MKTIKRADIIAAYILIKFIRVYQKTLSLDHGPLRFIRSYGCCKYHPTCSDYGISALQKKGAVRGTVLIIKRVLRCNPWSKGGVDYVD